MHSLNYGEELRNWN